MHSPRVLQTTQRLIVFELLVVRDHSRLVNWRRAVAAEGSMSEYDYGLDAHTIREYSIDIPTGGNDHTNVLTPHGFDVR